MAIKILITNDDSASAKQLVPLIRHCRKYGDVTVVVPKFEQSGKSHGIELHKGFEVKELELASDVTVWAVDSTPADCVRFARFGLNMTFDLVISGINRGLNMGTDIMYSGTVSAAMEGAFLGMKALAISTPPRYYESAIHHLDEIFRYIENHRLWEYHNLYNVNIPVNPKSIRITTQGGPYYSDDFQKEENDIYRPCGKCVYVNQNDLSLDTDCIDFGHISITPLSINRTDISVYNQLKKLNG